MRLSPKFSFLVLALAIVVVAAIVLVGCGRNESTPTAPQSAVPAPEGSIALPTNVIPASSPALLAAEAAQDRATPSLLATPGVLGTGTSADQAGRPVIVVYTERSGVAGLPREIEGYAVRIVVSGPIVPYAKPGGGGTLQMGTSTGNDNECAAGTLGCVVVKGGNDYFLSNNHVFARENHASIGEQIDAPGRYDGKPICSATPICGTLSAFNTISFSSNNTIDAAIAKPDPSRPYTQVEASGYDPTSTPVEGAVGMAVKKTGRTSGLTHGNIQAVNVTIRVQYTDGIATFIGQLQMNGSFIRSGDSGSLMVTESTNDPVGLCFAGGGGASFANRIQPVLTQFSATVK